MASAPSNPDVVYALIESTHSGLFRSEDGGKTWQPRDASQMMVWRPFYFANLIVDPKNENKLYKPGGGLIMSEDGGKSFSSISGGAHGDFHDVWIDPDNTNQVIIGDDGGVWYSYDGANTWWKADNLPISQFYHASVDLDNPYHVYGGLQDNSVWVGDSAYPGGITNSRWENLYGGDGFWAFADPADTDYVYVESQGGTSRARQPHGRSSPRNIQPQPHYGEGKLRFNWNTPVHLSPNEQGTLYIGAQFLFRSRDHGQTWDRISPDLTTNDPDKQKQEESGGVTVDNSSAETHTTIYTISESPRDGRTIWAGTDDGNLQLTRDGGKTWTNVVDRVPDLPRASWVSWVEASRFDAATAYATFDRHTFGDMTPYIYKTTDHGQTWKRIGTAGGIRGYAHVIKEDTVSPNLLFLGTEFGLWISIDGGQQWAQYKGGDFPSVAVRDIVVHPRESDLILATHGRGIWIVDDITPLRNLTPAVMAQDAAFLAGRPTQQRLSAGGGWVEGSAAFTGADPPDAALITYYQKKRHIYGRMKIEILDNQGKRVDTLQAKSRRGISRVEWPMRLKAPRVPPAATAAFEASTGPRVLPGTYTVKLTRGQETYTTSIEIGLDARARYTLEDRKLQFAVLTRLSNLLGDMSFEVERVNRVRDALLDRAGKLDAGDFLRQQLADLAPSADQIRQKIVATKEGGAITGELRIREKTTELYGEILGYEGRPTDYQVTRLESLQHELADVSSEFDSFLAQHLSSVRHPPRSGWLSERGRLKGGCPGGSVVALKRASML